MFGIENKLIVLKLNRSWQPVGHSLVSKALVDLCGGLNCFALDIDYPTLNGEIDFDHPTIMRPVDWDEWIGLPIRSWDFTINTPNRVVRVPTVLIAKNFSKMPIKKFKGKPSKKAIWMRDRGIDQYTGRKLKEEDASLDHVIPLSRGGDSTWTNLVLTDKQINYMKGNKTNEAAGLKLLREPQVPGPLPVSALYREPRHIDWKHFLHSTA